MSIAGPGLGILITAFLLLRSMKRLIPHHYNWNCPMDQQLIIFVQQNRRRCKKLNLTVKHYGHTVLQLGLLYLEFLDIINIPQTYRWNISSGELRSVFSGNGAKYPGKISCEKFASFGRSSSGCCSVWILVRANKYKRKSAYEDELKLTDKSWPIYQPYWHKLWSVFHHNSTDTQYSEQLKEEDYIACINQKTKMHFEFKK